MEPIPTVPGIHPGSVTMAKLAFTSLLAGQRGREEVDAVGAAAAARLLLVGARGGVHRCDAAGGEGRGESFPCRPKPKGEMRNEMEKLELERMEVLLLPGQYFISSHLISC